jgi:hypothetical protein
MVELRVGLPDMRGAYLQNKEIIRMSPAGADDPPMLKLACLYRVRKIKWVLERTIVLPLRGEPVSRSSHGELLSERERERERESPKKEVPFKWSSLFYIKGSHLLSKLHLGPTRVKHVGP